MRPPLAPALARAPCLPLRHQPLLCNRRPLLPVICCAAAEAYFRQHPLVVARRVAKVGAYVMRFATALVSAQVDRVILGVRPPPGVSGPYWLGCRWLAAGGRQVVCSLALLAVTAHPLGVPHHRAQVAPPRQPCQLRCTGTTLPHMILLLPQEEAPALVLQGLAAKMGPTFVKLAQTLRWGNGRVHATPQSSGFTGCKPRRMKQVC